MQKGTEKESDSPMSRTVGRHSNPQGWLTDPYQSVGPAL